MQQRQQQPGKSVEHRFSLAAQPPAAMTCEGMAAVTIDAGAVDVQQTWTPFQKAIRSLIPAAAGLGSG